MSEDKNRILLALLRSLLSDSELSESDKDLCTGKLLDSVIKLAKRHDVSHLLAMALEKNQISTFGDQALKNEVMKAVYRYKQLNFELDNICRLLESVEVDFLPLKGSVLRKYYPKPWMRTSCDIDILVHEADLDRIVGKLSSEYGYTSEPKRTHDVSVFSEGGVHIELHYTLIEDDDCTKETASVLENVWQSSTLRSGYNYLFEMSDELFYFYHIAHMAKHFEHGGCGIRTLIDLWILDGIMKENRENRDKLLEQGGLLKFADTVRAVSRVWFGGEAHTDITRRTEEFIILGGIYGTTDARILIQQQKKGGKLGFALSKIFLPYDALKLVYPVLQKHKWLTPIMQVRRWLRLAFCGHFKRSMRELASNAAISKKEARETQQFLKDIGL